MLLMVSLAWLALARSDTECPVALACQQYSLNHAGKWDCVRRGLMELQPERMEVSGEKYLVLHQEGVGMANCFMWHLRMGMIAAAVTGRKLVFNWPAVSRNFNTNPDHALIASLARLAGT